MTPGVVVPVFQVVVLNLWVSTFFGGVGVMYQISCMLDSSIMNYNSSKMTALKKLQDNFMVGGTVTTT